MSALKGGFSHQLLWPAIEREQGCVHDYCVFVRMQKYICDHEYKSTHTHTAVKMEREQIGTVWDSRQTHR